AITTSISLLGSLPHLSALPLQPPHALLLPIASDFSLRATGTREQYGATGGPL
uniref:Uncharacterized protein n=1 Tax=Aegilops tauschii subsp. strangulata TaxID=200361 RepID=A0A453S0F8_AEGTS